MRAFPCNTCHRTFGSVFSLNQHRQDVHNTRRAKALAKATHAGMVEVHGSLIDDADPINIALNERARADG